MYHHTNFKAIGEGQEGPVPAMRRSLKDIVQEYESKKAEIATAMANFKNAVEQLKVSASIGGEYGGNIFDRDPHLEREEKVQLVLLKSAWRHVHKGLNIDYVASAADKKRFEMAMESPLPFTLENIAELYGDFLLNPRHYILKGLAECFCALDPAYKSHNKVKIGVDKLPKRIIITGYNGLFSNTHDKIRDVLNALRAVRGEGLMEYAEGYELTQQAQKTGKADFDSGYIRAFQNGNVHIHFDDRALLDINRALAEFYGDVLADSTEAAQETKKAGTAVSKDLAFYPTPAKVADQVIAALEIRDGQEILEPSCGDGALLEALDRWTRRHSVEARVLGVECDSGRVATCRRKGFNVVQDNFLELPEGKKFDRIIMNPPFCGKHYKKHLGKAVAMLKPGGKLVSILPATAHYDHGNSIGRWVDLPVASFAESGTNVPVGYTVFTKPKEGSPTC